MMEFEQVVQKLDVDSHLVSLSMRHWEAVANLYDSLRKDTGESANDAALSLASSDEVIQDIEDNGVNAARYSSRGLEFEIHL